jgi:hypothetical protein
MVVLGLVTKPIRQGAVVAGLFLPVVSALKIVLLIFQLGLEVLV